MRTRSARDAITSSSSVSATGSGASWGRYATRSPRCRSTSPCDGSRVAAMTPSSDVLPAPLAPTTAMRSRGSMRSSTPEKTVRVPKARPTPVRWTRDTQTRLAVQRERRNPSQKRPLGRLLQLGQGHRALEAVADDAIGVDEVHPWVGLQPKGVERGIHLRRRTRGAGGVVRLDVLEQHLAAELRAEL